MRDFETPLVGTMVCYQLCTQTLEFSDWQDLQRT